MTVFDLFDSIGNIDDELIENAAKQKKSHKRLFYCAASMAACVAIAFVSLFVWNANQGDLIPAAVPQTTSSSDNGDVLASTAGKNSETSAGESSAEIALLRESYKIYYVKDGKIESKTQECDAAPKEVFELWKKANNIGDEVRFISVKVEDNGTESYYEFSGMQIAQYTPGDYKIYCLTVTRNLENYYGENKELLLESLKKTMTGMSDPEPDEYILTFDDEEQADTESKNPDNP